MSTQSVASVHRARAGDGLLLRHDGSHDLEEQGSQQCRGEVELTPTVHSFI